MLQSMRAILQSMRAVPAFAAHAPAASPLACRAVVSPNRWVLCRVYRGHKQDVLDLCWSKTQVRAELCIERNHSVVCRTAWLFPGLPGLDGSLVLSCQLSGAFVWLAVPALGSPRLFPALLLHLRPALVSPALSVCPPHTSCCGRPWAKPGQNRGAATAKPLCPHCLSSCPASYPSTTQFLLSASMDKTVRLWHVSMDECLRVFK